MIHITDPDSTPDVAVYTDHAWTDAEINDADDRYMLYCAAVLAVVVGVLFGWLWALRCVGACVVGWLCAAGWEWVTSPRKL